MLRASIPQDTRLIVVGKEESLGAEKFRFLAVRLRHLRQSRPLKKILITSTIPQEVVNQAQTSKDDVQSIARLVVKYPFPTLDLLRIGFFF